MTKTSTLLKDQTLPITIQAYKLVEHGKKKGVPAFVDTLHLIRKVHPEYESVKDKIDQVKQMYGGNIRIKIVSAKESEAEMIKRRERQGLVLVETEQSMAA